MRATAPSRVLIGAVLALLAVPVDPATPERNASRDVSEDAGPSDEAKTPLEGHKEVPVAPPRVPVSRDSLPRSPRAVVIRGLHHSVQVNVDSQQNNLVGDAANEPSLAIDPTDPDNLVIGWRQFDTVASDFRQAGVAYSHDGGATWTFPGVLQPGQFRSDPVLAADSSGVFYYYSLSSTTTTEYFVSTNEGVSWTGPTSSPGGDKNWHAIDVSGGTGDGHIYPIWNSQFTCCAPGTDFSRSTNGALTFEGPYILPQHPKWGTDDAGPDGELYIVGATLDATSHLLLRSDNADEPLLTPTFALVKSINLGGVTSSGGIPNPGGLLGQVWVAVDRSAGASRGTVYVLGSVNPPGSDPLDVHIIRSTDHGQTFSSPVRVNDDPAGNGAYQWFGTMSVSPGGRIDVVWNDTRAGPATRSELYYAYSVDQGATWSSGLPVTPSYDSTIGYPVQNKMGDYYHMVSLDNYAGLAYAATFNGEQDVYYLRVGDCNDNGVHDSIDLSSMTSPDVNANRIPDECEPDCNDNGVPDSTDIALQTSDDCNANAVPDECDVAAGTSDDCDADGVLDECDVTYNLETAQGFTVGAGDDTATTGVWTRVDPVGTAAQPEDDRSPTPGTMCFVTGQGVVGGGLGDNDVDGGKTTLRTPTLDLSGLDVPWIGYWRWYSNNTGSEPGADTFLVDLSNNGGASWSNVEIVGPTGAQASGGWFFHIFRVSDIATPTASVVLRFVASDLAGGSIIEAAIDDVVVVDCASCSLSVPPEVANLRLARSLTVADLAWDAVANAAAYNVYRGGQRDASDLGCFLPGVTGTTAVDDGLVPTVGQGLFYITTAVNCAGESTLGSGLTPAIPCP
jgi:hypothetical protein